MGYDRGYSIPFDFKPNCGDSIKEYCHHDHIPFNLKGNMNLVFSVQASVVMQPTRIPLTATRINTLAQISINFSVTIIIAASDD